MEWSPLRSRRSCDQCSSLHHTRNGAKNVAQGPLSPSEADWFGRLPNRVLIPGTRRNTPPNSRTQNCSRAITSEIILRPNAAIPVGNGHDESDEHTLQHNESVRCFFRLPYTRAAGFTADHGGLPHSRPHPPPIYTQSYQDIVRQRDRKTTGIIPDLGGLKKVGLCHDH
jgi:hypothetical protein